MKLSRRAFLALSGAAAGGLIKYYFQNKAKENRMAQVFLPAIQAQKIDTTFGITVSSIQREAPVVKAAGASSVAGVHFLWRDLSPIRGHTFLYPQMDEDVNALDGLQIVAQIKQTPLWAQVYPGCSCGAFDYHSFAEWYDFLRALVMHFKDRIHIWQIWNEPDVARQQVNPNEYWGCWNDLDREFEAGQSYALAMRESYLTIKGIDPTATVMLGGMMLDNPNDLNFLCGFFSAYGDQYFDVFDIHSYDYYIGGRYYENSNWGSLNIPALALKVAKIRQFTNKPLACTEFALLNDGPITDDYQSTKADYIKRVLSFAKENSLFTAIWYNLTGWRGSALVNPDLTPLPALKAFSGFVSSH